MDHRQDPETKRKLSIHQEKNSIVQNSVDEIILQENK